MSWGCMKPPFCSAHPTVAGVMSGTRAALTRPRRFSQELTGNVRFLQGFSDVGVQSGGTGHDREDQPCPITATALPVSGKVRYGERKDVRLVLRGAPGPLSARPQRGRLQPSGIRFLPLPRLSWLALTSSPAGDPACPRTKLTAQLSSAPLCRAGALSPPQDWPPGPRLTGARVACQISNPDL